MLLIAESNIACGRKFAVFRRRVKMFVIYIQPKFIGLGIKIVRTSISYVSKVFLCGHVTMEARLLYSPSTVLPNNVLQVKPPASVCVL